MATTIQNGRGRLLGISIFPTVLRFTLASYLALGALSAEVVAAPESADAKAVVAQLEVALRSEDRGDIVRAMNEAKRGQDSKEVLALVTSIWRGHVSGVRREILRDPTVRIEAANLLAQASNNGFAKVDREELRRYSRRVLELSNEDPKPTAILNLGLLNDPSDVPLLKKIAEEENPRTFRPAIISLARICNENATRAIGEVRGKVKSPTNREFANTPISELVPFRQCPRP